MHNQFDLNLNHKKFFNNKGFSLVEILVATSILTVLILGVANASAKGVSLANRALKEVQAETLLSEGAEAIRSQRDNAWSNISNLQVGTTYYLSFNTTTNTWSSTTTPNTIDNTFTRSFVVSNVNRNSNDDIAVSGTLDTGTKLFTETVSFPYTGGTVSRNLSFYLSNIFE